MKKIHYFLFFIVSSMFFFSCSREVDNKKEVSEIIRKANVVYTPDSFQEGHPHVPPMVSNGIVGASFDHMGFQSRPNTGIPEGRTVFGYIDNYDRNETSRQIQFPLAIIQAEFADGSSFMNLMDAENYRQELDLFDGVLTTEYDLFGPTKIVAYAHQTEPNLFVMKINRKPDDEGKTLVMKINCETSAAQNNDFGWPVDPIQTRFDIKDNGVMINSVTDLSETDWMIMTDNPISIEGNIVTIPLEAEENEIRFIIRRNDSKWDELLQSSYDELLSSHTDEWHRLWNISWIDFPEERAHYIWTRTKYYALSHFPVIPEKPTIPTGLNSNIWGFTFPQDVYYIAENLPRLGHFDRAETAMEYWLEVLPEVKKYAKRVIEVEGAFYPWTPPFTDWDSYEKDGVVSPDSYQLHNSAYVLALVWHYYLYSGDKQFLIEYFPVIEEVFRYYADISSKNEKGTYDVYHEHARGQDEASSTEGKLKNLLCASYSAQYSTRTYIQACEIIGECDQDLLEKARDMNSSGLTRETFLKEEGYYSTYEGDTRPPNSQKHPVQLNPIAYVPMPDLVTENSPVVEAWENRYDLTIGAKKPLTLGWTVGEFALASCRMRNPEALEKDLWTVQTCRGADPRWIQFYESSFWEGWHLMKSYYLPMMGLYLQTFTDAIVQDWRGYIDIFPTLLEDWQDERIDFKGIHTLNGIEVSGWYDNGEFEVELLADRDQEVQLRISLDDVEVSAENFMEGQETFRGNEEIIFKIEEGKSLVLKNN